MGQAQPAEIRQEKGEGRVMMVVKVRERFYLEQHFGEIKNEVFFLRTRIATFKGACGVDVSGNNCLPKQVLQSDY